VGEGRISSGQPRPIPKFKIFVTRMLTRDPFAVAFLFAPKTICSVPYIMAAISAVITIRRIGLCTASEGHSIVK